MKFKKNIGIDLGTVKTRLILAEKGIIYEQPTIIATDKLSKKIIAVGDEAEEMVGKTPTDIEITRPIKNSVLLNYRATESLFRHLITTGAGRVSFVKPNVILSVPSVITSVEKRALEEAALNAGAGEVYLYPSSFLSALGAELMIDRPFGNMIVNMGGGTTETAIISLNGIVTSSSSKFASLSINEALINYFRKIYGLIIGEVMAEKIKTKITSAIIVDEQKELEVRGRDATTGMPRNIMIKTNDVYEAVKPILNEIVLSVRSVLEKALPELSSDIVDTGIVVCGGGVLLDKFSNLLVKALGIPVVMAENPQHATALGIKKILEDFERYGYKGKSR
jgi:rod shape-determining protein MreB and related proteins